jgi:hypothetical protein
MGPNLNAECSLEKNRMKSMLDFSILLENFLDALQRRNRVSNLVFSEKWLQGLNVNTQWGYK